MTFNIVLPLNIVKSSTRLRKQQIFIEYKEFASVPNHPAFTDIPKPWQFPNTQSFLTRHENIHALWDCSDIRKGIKELAQHLDSDWPEWAATRTNAFGTIISDLFAHFLSWLNSLPAHARSGNVGSAFEQHLFAEAEARHTLEFWCDSGVPPPSWFHLSQKAEKWIMNPGQPVIPKAKGRPSWRYYHEMMKSDGSWTVVEALPEGGWVYV
ncbi:hypothetical protein RHS02_00681, partial [Rhizoctonia solani]